MKIYSSQKMHTIIISFLIGSLVIFSACEPGSPRRPQPSSNPLIGTWQLIEGRLTENGKTAITSYGGDTSFIKIINPTHFAFLQHDSKKDGTGFFSAGGGYYTLRDSIYTEHLEYCNARSWEGNKFTFTIRIKGDTLIQSGVEKIDSLGVDRVNTEIYVKLQ